MKQRAWKRLFVIALMILCSFCISHTKLCSVKATAASEAQGIQSAKEEIRHKKTGKYGMIPVYPRDITDGTYEIAAESDSPFFKIEKAVITVEGDRMYVSITIPSLSYLYVFPGTREEAAKADEQSWIGYRKENKHSTFTFRVDALDQEFDCAAYSKKKKRWYDRKIVLDASTLPDGALHFKLPDYELIEKAILAYPIDESEENSEGTVSELQPPESVSISYPDGEYSIEVNMTGGSGRASISSPTLLIVQDGCTYAQLLWSSMYYDYMLIDGVRYENLTTDGGNSKFEIPITAMDEAMTVIADTTAMGDPIEIEYQLTFYQDTIDSKSQIPQEAAKKVLVIALGMIIVGGILNHILKKRSR